MSIPPPNQHQPTYNKKKNVPSGNDGGSLPSLPPSLRQQSPPSSSSIPNSQYSNSSYHGNSLYRRRNTSPERKPAYIHTKSNESKRYPHSMGGVLPKRQGSSSYTSNTYHPHARNPNIDNKNHSNENSYKFTHSFQKKNQRSLHNQSIYSKPIPSKEIPGGSLDNPPVSSSFLNGDENNRGTNAVPGFFPAPYSQKGKPFTHFSPDGRTDKYKQQDSQQSNFIKRVSVNFILHTLFFHFQYLIFFHMKYPSEN